MIDRAPVTLARDADLVPGGEPRSVVGGSPRPPAPTTSAPAGRLRVMKQAPSIGATPPILPGSALGVLGSGQLGRMFAIAARRMGYRVHTFSPDTDTPTGQVADLEVTASYDDLDAVRRFAGDVAVVTFEFENVPAATAAGGGRARTRPAGRERPAHHPAPLAREDIPGRARLPRHALPGRAVGRAILRDCCRRPGLPGRAEDRRLRVRRQGAGEAGRDRRRRGGRREVARGPSGSTRRSSTSTARFPSSRPAGRTALRPLGRHRERPPQPHPRPVASPRRTSRPTWQRKPSRSPAACSKQLDVVGVLCVEFFLTQAGKLLVNELAPRPHNSGHLTIDAERHQPVRAAAAGRLRPAAGLDPPAPPGRHGEPARRPLGRRRTRLGGRVRHPRTSSCTCTAKPTPGRAERWAT